MPSRKASQKFSQASCKPVRIKKNLTWQKFHPVNQLFLAWKTMHPCRWNSCKNVCIILQVTKSWNSSFHDQQSPIACNLSIQFNSKKNTAVQRGLSVWMEGEQYLRQHWDSWTSFQFYQYHDLKAKHQLTTQLLHVEGIIASGGEDQTDTLHAARAALNQSAQPVSLIPVMLYNKSICLYSTNYLKLILG